MATRVQFGSLHAFDEKLRKFEPEVVEQFLDPSRWDWLTPPILDITAGARQAAKIAYYATIAPTLDEREAAEIGDLPEPLV
jgi:hypothetical protein